VTKAGAQYFAICEHDFHSTLGQKVIAVWTYPEPALERIAENAAARASSRRIEGQRDAMLPKVLIQLTLRDARLDDCERKLRIDLDDPVHSTQIDDHVVIARRES
jgi:hypothetical protein